MVLVRHGILLLHRYVGLALALFLIVLGLTGSLLAFNRDLERLISPQLFVDPLPSSKMLGLADLAERAQALVPEARVVYLYVEPDQVTVTVLPRAGPSNGAPAITTLFLDPATGRELGRRQDGDLSEGLINLMPFIYRLHRELAAGPWGAFFLGVLALVWSIDCVVALYLTFPKGWREFWRRWKPSWQVKRRTSTFRLNFDLHRAGSLWLWPALFMFAWSSVMFDLPTAYEWATKSLFATTTLESILAAASHPNDTPQLNWHQAETIGARLMAELAEQHHFAVRTPDGIGYLPEQGVYVYDAQTSLDVWRFGWKTGIWLDGDTGALRMFMPTTGDRLGDTISTWLRALHFGDVANSFLYRCFDCLMGLALAALSATGVYVWLRKRAARKHARRAIAGAS